MSELVVQSESGSLPDKIRFAQALAGSSLLPRTYQQQPANVLVAIEMGHALGIAPIVAINEINVINGSPSLSASLMAALARQAGHKVRVTGDASSATCTIVRADDPDFEHAATWDEAKAKAASLWGKGHWAKDPATMLRWRAVSECVRFACSEVLGGIRYTPEEVQDMQPERVTVSQVPDEKPAKPKTIAEAVAEHQEMTEAFSEPVVIDLPEQPEFRTEAQSKKLAILMRDTQMQREEGLSWMSGLIGRDIDSTKQLTKAEASKVIDALQSAADAGADPKTGEVVEAELVDAEPKGR